MIPVCAKQGVLQKISFSDFLSAMLSDYECAYACGMAAAFLNISVKDDTSLKELKENLDRVMPEGDNSDFRKENLFQLIRDYAPAFKEPVPEEIPVLIHMGYEDGQSEMQG